ncbi:adhesion G protein-coupled receptor E2-like [Paramacrobiotus metropolitanus]|uniref:adhesion G protein-coupled receptor E2-like n=1 Tax=Paramacrobiotus metropolitanus TaxID=2943436 RepID=UPI002445AF7D|nr:adhesion G protein-coupled receptor E2-like [Paramacrobiotus metropolitanus]XP_055357750.1 adhesion G protein-coupled receptor E2-like [Paramacrobiotus metropolitanus]XP_055357751.1 adhesion G protein-coupled receptor E2-like [Paramacrobiotus metropolitanus]XP_055357752.1 adhesion G protein-coupled receptor E2-like [Paramacrobiotus metropolitanus]XP_055357753.1 adhesion G protein-coupled receptor E2-like [Paramacrobiotus metropolitanus]
MTYNETTILPALLDIDVTRTEILPNSPMINGIQQMLVVIGSSLSLVFIAFAFITFTLFSDLKDLAGYVMINLFTAVFLGQLFLLIGMDQADSDALCHFFAITLHFAWLGAFFWISIGIYDISQDVKTRLAPSIQDGNHSLRNHLIAYTLYGWGLPAVIVLLCTVVYLLKYDAAAGRAGFVYIDPRRPHCWMVGKDGIVVGLVLPFVWLIAISAYWFCRSWQTVHRTTLLSYKSGVRKQFKRPEMILLHLYLKIILIYLCTWLIGFVAALCDVDTLWLCFVGALSSVGSFVALLFTCNSAVFTIYSSTKKRSRRHSSIHSYGAPSEMSYNTTLSLLTLREVPEIDTV